VIRTLTAGDLDAIHAAFLEAFSDYVVRLSPTREQLEEMLVRRGYVPELSVAVEEEGRMVAFTLNGVDGDCAYDSGTGVVPSHRRRGLARKLMEASFDLLSREYVLEVIDSNTLAISLYKGLGFEETRGLQCWTFEQAKGDVSVEASFEPSWQNSDGSLARARDRHVTIEDAGGSVILFPSTGDLPRLRGRITTGLLVTARERAGKPLRIMNVDERAQDVAAFLEAAGATKIVRQLELRRRP
jgi:GNAT superfamily N-acetyltransferase